LDGTLSSTIETQKVTKNLAIDGECGKGYVDFVF
jgi:hypothetical protein